MAKYIVRLTAEISDDIEVEADSDTEAIANAHADWQFVEAHSWGEDVLERPSDHEDEQDQEDDD